MQTTDLAHSPSFNEKEIGVHKKIMDLSKVMHHTNA